MMSVCGFSLLLQEVLAIGIRNPRLMRYFILFVLLMYELLPLPYDYDALEPSIDKHTMKVHYTKHYQ